MRRGWEVAVFMVVLALAVGLTLPARVQARGEEPLDQKVVELLKLQQVVLRAEHGQFHEGMDRMVKKYANDPDVRTVCEAMHETMHQRMAAQERTAAMAVSDLGYDPDELTD